jgi:hypothetical protein
MMNHRLVGLLLLALCAGPSSAQHQGHRPAKAYSGQQTRTIKSLSEADIAELRRGGGWGLAKAAELNGVPGPAHLLELTVQIPLSAAQAKAIEDIYQRMRSAAIAEGTRLIDLERALDQRFRDGKMTHEVLDRSLEQIEASRRRLRYIHLSAHLETPPLLTEVQIARYKALRGYGEEPCTDVPEGRDESTWRKHHGCD